MLLTISLGFSGVSTSSQEVSGGYLIDITMNGFITEDVQVNASRSDGSLVNVVLVQREP